MNNEQKNGLGDAQKRTGKQKYRLALIIGGVVLALILIVALLLNSLFVKPQLPTDQPDSDITDDSDEPSSIDGISPVSSGQRKSEDFYSILILGRDTGGGGNTDTMLLASYDVTNQKATVMSIPRDTMVNVSWDVKKINSVYNWYGGGEAGIEKLYQEISQLVGFEPDFQVVVEWEAVGEIVDAIGGVWFDVPYDMDYDDPLQNLHIHQEKGYRHLTGEDAMQVIRWRKNNSNSPYGNTNGVGDIGRMQIQQDFLKAMISELLQIKNVANINKLAAVFQENVATDLTLQNILWFGQQAVLGGLSVENVNFVTMPYKAASLYSREYSKLLGKATDLSYVVPVADELLALVNDALSPFAEIFELSDLDILSVNADGSISSSSGKVEDTDATYPRAYWVSQLEPEDEPESSIGEEGSTDIPDISTDPEFSTEPEPSNTLEETPVSGEPSEESSEPVSETNDPDTTTPSPESADQ